MPFDTTMQNTIIDNNRYQIVAVKTQADEIFFHFLWGKIDFKVSGVAADGKLTVRTFRIKRNDAWYHYKKVSSHGIFFEETQWVNNDDEIFIELPAKFSQIPEKIIIPTLQ